MLVGMGETVEESLTITNDGAKIVKLLSGEAGNPTIKLIAEAVEAQSEHAGDGTKSVAILIGHLLMKALELADQGLNRSIILRGYNIAYRKALELLNMTAVSAPPNRDLLEKVARTAMHGRGVGLKGEYDFLPGMVAEALLKVSEGRKVNLDDVKVEVYGAGLKAQSKLVEGVIVKPAYELERLHPSIPRRMENTRIALVHCPLEVERLRIRHELAIKTPKQLSQIRRYENEYSQSIVEKFEKLGVNVVLCGRRVDPLPQYHFGRKNILLARNVPLSDLKRLSKATGSRIVYAWPDIGRDDIGYAKLVEWRRLTPEGEWRLFIEGCLNPKSVTLLVLGSSVIVKEALNSMLKAAACTLEDGKYVGGGGAVETEIAVKLKSHAKTLGGLERLAVEAFAESLLCIPFLLSKNAGMSWLEVLPTLTAKHEKGEKDCGINAVDRRLVNVKAEGIIDPFKVKMHMIKIASETVLSLLRIDGILSAKR